MNESMIVARGLRLASTTTMTGVIAGEDLCVLEFVRELVEPGQVETWT